MRWYPLAILWESGEVTGNPAWNPAKAMHGIRFGGHFCLHRLLQSSWCLGQGVRLAWPRISSREDGKRRFKKSSNHTGSMPVLLLKPFFCEVERWWHSTYSKSFGWLIAFFIWVSEGVSHIIMQVGFSIKHDSDVDGEESHCGFVMFCANPLVHHVVPF